MKNSNNIEISLKILFILLISSVLYATVTVLGGDLDNLALILDSILGN